MLIRLVLLLGVVCSAAAAEPVKIVLLAGRPSHAPGDHEFNAGISLLEKMLRQNGDIEPVVVRGGWPEDESVFEGARSLVFFMDGGRRHPMVQDERLQLLESYMKKGVGMACLHYAVEVPAERGGPQLLDWIGGYYEMGYSKNPHNDVTVTRAAPEHPISRGWETFRANDEWYYQIRFRENDPRVTPILTAMLPTDAPRLETLAWARERADGGRGFGFTGAHSHANWGNDDFRRLLVNAVLWTAKVEIPAQGARCEITPQDLTEGLDAKPQRERRSGRGSGKRRRKSAPN